MNRRRAGGTARFTLAALTFATMLFTGCGGDDGGASSLRTTRLERTLDQRVREAFEDPAGDARCPTDVPAEPGTRFRCTVMVGSRRIGADAGVFEVDGMHQVLLRDVVLAVGEVQREVEARYFRETGTAGVAFCEGNAGPGAIVARIDRAFRCSVRAADGSMTQVKVNPQGPHGDLLIGI